MANKIVEYRGKRCLTCVYNKDQDRYCPCVTVAEYEISDEELKAIKNSVKADVLN